jgi:hypothetical protein
MNQRLSYKAHLEVIKGRIAIILGAFRRLIQSTWGYTLEAARTLYLSAVRPVLAFGALIWYPYGLKQPKKLKEDLNSLQGKFLRAITGAYKATAKAALEVEAFVEPLDLYIEKTATKSLLRQISRGLNRDISQFSTKLKKLIGKRKPRAVKDSRPFINAKIPSSNRGIELKQRLEVLKRLETPLFRGESTSESYNKDWNLYKRDLSQFYSLKWKDRWKNGKKGRVTARYIPEPTEKALELYKGRPRIASTAIIQLRTEKIGLNLFLNKRRVPNISPLCECGEGEESVEHFLYKCPRWN